MGRWGSWTLRDAITFIAVFVCIRIALIYFATQLFLAIIPDGDRCPICDGITLPIERSGGWRILGARFRRSWCLDCGWEGMLRRSAARVFGVSSGNQLSDDAMMNSRSQSGQLPLISKKSSK